MTGNTVASLLIEFGADVTRFVSASNQVRQETIGIQAVMGGLSPYLKAIEDEFGAVGKAGTLLSDDLNDLNKNTDSLNSGTVNLSRTLDSAAGTIRGYSVEIMQTGRSISALSGPIDAIGSKSIALAGQLEQTTIAFTTILHSSDAAKDHINQLYDFAARTPFNFTSLTEASRKLQAYGFDVKQVLPMLTTLGDAMAGLGRGNEGIARATLALGQMHAAGVVMKQDLNQLTALGINTSAILQEKLHLTAIQVANIGKLHIDSAKVITALLEGMAEQFGGSMVAQSQSLLGLYSNVEDGIDRALATIGTDLIKTFDLKDVVKMAGDQIKSLVDWYMKLGDASKFAIAGTGAFLGLLGPGLIVLGQFGLGVSGLVTSFGLIVKLGSGVASAIGYVTGSVELLGAAIGIATGPIGIIIGAVGIATAALIYFYKTNETVRNVVDSVWSGIKTIIGGAIDVIKIPLLWLIDSLKWIYEHSPDLGAIFAAGRETAAQKAALEAAAGNAPHHAAGTIVNGPQLALIGEAGPEAVVPLSGGPVAAMTFLSEAMGLHRFAGGGIVRGVNSNSMLQSIAQDQDQQLQDLLAQIASSQSGPSMADFGREQREQIPALMGLLINGIISAGGHDRNRSASGVFGHLSPAESGFGTADDISRANDPEAAFIADINELTKVLDGLGDHGDSIQKLVEADDAAVESQNQLALASMVNVDAQKRDTEALIKMHEGLQNVAIGLKTQEDFLTALSGSLHLTDQAAQQLWPNVSNGARMFNDMTHAGLQAVGAITGAGLAQLQNVRAQSDAALRLMSFTQNFLAGTNPLMERIGALSGSLDMSSKGFLMMAQDTTVAAVESAAGVGQGFGGAASSAMGLAGTLTGASNIIAGALGMKASVPPSDIANAVASAALGLGSAGAGNGAVTGSGGGFFGGTGSSGANEALRGISSGSITTAGGGMRPIVLNLTAEMDGETVANVTRRYDSEYDNRNLPW